MALASILFFSPQGRIPPPSPSPSQNQAHHGVPIIRSAKLLYCTVTHLLQELLYVTTVLGSRVLPRQFGHTGCCTCKFATVAVAYCTVLYKDPIVWCLRRPEGDYHPWKTGEGGELTCFFTKKATVTYESPGAFPPPYPPSHLLYPFPGDAI